MKRILSAALASCALFATASPAMACRGPQFEKTIYPVMEEKPELESGALGEIFKVRFSGERSGRQDRLWPNFYIVDVLEGKRKGEKLAIPAHVTSCDSVAIAMGAQGFVVGTLAIEDRDGKPLDIPILQTGYSGRVEGFPGF